MNEIIKMIADQLKNNEITKANLLDISHKCQELFDAIQAEENRISHEEQMKKSAEWAKRVTEVRAKSKAKKIAETRANQARRARLSPSRQHLIED